MKSEDPIGVFDSGIGGLTVVREIISLMPNENIIYFGDTARVPYGNKSAEVVRQYAAQDAKFLLSKNVKMIVVACNTASAVALDVVKSISNVPTIGVIQPTAMEALTHVKSKGIGVIGTLATINSCAYSSELRKHNETLPILSRACPLFVPLAEEGLFDHPATEILAREYLIDLIGKIDVLILGCTHYPLLKKPISNVLGKDVILIDAGEATAKAVKASLEARGLLNQSRTKPLYKFFVSDFPQKFNEIAESFLGRKLENVSKVRIHADGEIV